MDGERRAPAEAGVLPVMVAACFAGSELGAAVFDRVEHALAAAGSVEIRVAKTQVAFRRRRGFAYLWLPERHLGPRWPPGVVVLSFALGRAEASPRIKQVVRVSPLHWMHHLEVRDADEIDETVTGWLLEAAARAG